MDFVLISKFYIAGKYDISETGSVSIFRCGEGDAYSIGSLRKSLKRGLVTG
jgi:hypothetical protein